MKSFCFATVTSTGYLDQAAGLVLNLEEQHPGETIVVCCLDNFSFEKFKIFDSHGVVRVMAKDVWDASLWENMRLRMNQAEIAYATKSAIACWILEHYAQRFIFLDNDLLFLKPINDLKEELQNYDVLLVPNRRPIERLRRSPIPGLFCAGLYGFSTGALKYANFWKKLCFEFCRETLEDGLYFEQRYLDPFIILPNALVCSDPGINVVGTHMNYHKPYQDASGVWRVRSGEEVIVFHVARGTTADFPLTEQKRQLNNRGREMLGLPVLQGGGEEKAPKISKLNFGSLFLSCRYMIRDCYVALIHVFFNVKRLAGLREGNMLKRLLALYHKRKILASWSGPDKH